MIKVLLVGDSMLDIYSESSSIRMSPEAPIPIMTNPTEKITCGGAANVAVNLASLGCEVTFLTNIGTDQNGQFLTSALNAVGVVVKSFDEEYVTITKTRFLSQGQQILRVDYETPYSADAQDLLYTDFLNIVSSFDAVVFSDYCKGVLTNIQKMIEIAKSHNINVYVDPKDSDSSVFRGATCITPNRLEAERIFGIKNVEDIKVKNIKTLNIDHVIITLADKGALLINQLGVQHFHTEKVDVVDVTGAGDCFISGLLYTHHILGQPINDAVQNSIRAASKAVRYNGNYILQIEDFSEGATVFTNGCFDILHAGHVDFLNRAAELGIKLIVGLNSDTSVKRLKGEDRPINTFEDRKSVLLGLQAVDEVIGFSDDTPEKLIKKIKPGILVKGGDYSIHDIIGKEFVESYGGRVTTLDFNISLSTSQLVKKCQKIDI